VTAHGRGVEVFQLPTLVCRAGSSFRLVLRSWCGPVGDLELSGAAFDPTTLILVARPKKLFREWRLIVASSEIIAGSQNRNDREVAVVAGCPDEVLAFARTTLEQVEWRPDPMFVMDVCDWEDGLRLIELNSFGCSGHYLADVATVVERASMLAALCW
jgi:hypothetical protein